MIIAVCGNSGSGKSTLALKIATLFAHLDRNTILVDTDFVTPQFNIWYPKKEMYSHSSLAVLLDNNIDTETVANKLCVVNNTLGVLGYARDFSANAMPRRPDTAMQLLETLQNMADVVVVDIQTGFINDILSFEAMSSADIRIVTLTPDIKGLSWYDSNIRMLEESWKNLDAHVIRVLNKTHPTAPLAEIEQTVGTIPYYLPFSVEIEEQMNTGTLPDITLNTAPGKQYMGVVQSLVGVIEQQFSYNE